MAEYNSNVTLGGFTLYVTSVTPTKKPGTIKQKLGRKIVEHQVIGRQTSDWSIQISGEMYTGTTNGVTRSAQRANLEGMDDAEAYAYTDDIHDGNYIIVPGSLSFSDTSDTEMVIYYYSMTLIQYNQ